MTLPNFARRAQRLAFVLGAFLGGTWCAQAAAVESPTVLVVVGAPGEEEFGRDFDRQADLWRQVAGRAGAVHLEIGRGAEDNETDFEKLKTLLEREPPDCTSELWLVFIGHGTFDGKEAKFNLRGPDVSATDLVGWLQPFQRPMAFINTASASAPFLARLSGKNRIVVTATRSGYEQNFARFGRYFAEMVGDPAGDLDKDGQTSLLEAFLSASYRVTEYYRTEGRLATEHALIDDNGDGLGTPAAWFRGVRATKQAREGVALDGARAHQFHLIPSEAERKLSPQVRLRRNEIELAIEELRESKPKLEEADYYRRLEALLLELAELYEAATARES